MADKDKPQTALTVQQRAGALATEAIARFRGMDSARRTRLAAVVALVIGCFAGLLWYATRTDWRTLYAGLDPDDAREMAQELTAAGIPYDVSPDGGALRVPAENLDKARLATTAKGGPKSGRMGFELFDKPNWMGSEFDEKVNYQRALEGELEHTIATLASVQSASVHLVLPHDSLFTTEQRDAKASVVLKLRHRTMAPEEAEAIANLVASAVDDLRPENVVLVNAEGGGMLGKPTGDALLATHEQELAQKLVETLEPLAGTGNVRASVNVDYDPTSTDEVDETYDPAQAVTLSMQRSEQTSGQAAASGIPGTASNAPTGKKPPLYPPQNDGQQNLKQESDTYGVSKKVRHTVEAAGKVRRLTAAVLINDRRVMRGKQESWEARTPEELKRITDLAESAIGFDAARGDQVNVEEMAFDENAASPVPPLSERLLGMASESGELIRYGTILAALLVFVFFVARPALGALNSPPIARKAVRGGAAPALPAQPVTQELTAEQQLAEQKKLRAQTVFEQVSEHVKREPTQSTRLLESWIRSE